MAEKTVVLSRTPTLRNNDAPPDNSKLGTLYRFPKTITVLSIRAKEPKESEEVGTMRDFKSAHLVHIDKKKKNYFFTGHKITSKGSSCSKRIQARKYCFIVGFDEMKQLTGELKGELAQTA